MNIIYIYMLEPVTAHPQVRNGTPALWKAWNKATCFHWFTDMMFIFGVKPLSHWHGD